LSQAPDDPVARFAEEGGAELIDLQLKVKEREERRAASEAKKAQAEAKRRAEEAAKNPTRFTAKQLLELQLPPMRWLVQDLIPPGMVVLASPPKIGKTWLNLQLAVSVATGTKFASYAMTQFGKVLFLDLEGGQRREQYRLQKVLGDTPVPEQLHIAFDWPNMNNGGLELLDRYIAEEGYVLVIIDIWNKFRRRASRNVNLYDWDSEVGQEIQTIARKHDITILLTHHTKKGAVDDHMESISGSQGLPGAADTNIVITRQRGTGNAVIYVTPRDGKEHHLAVEFNDGLWSILGDAAEVNGSKRRSAVHGLLTVRGCYMAPKDIAEELEDDVRSVRRILRKMRDDGAVEQNSKGQYRVKDAGKLV
jgi:hypothetical protein